MTARVLIVEDDPASLELATEILSDGGFVVLAARHGEKAIELVKTEAPDLVLLDLTLAGPGGLAVAQALKEDEATAHLPLVAVSGSRIEVKPPFAGYIAKPIQARQFASQVRAFLDG